MRLANPAVPPSFPRARSLPWRSSPSGPASAAGGISGASSHLRPYAVLPEPTQPARPSLGAESRLLQRASAEDLTDLSAEVYCVMDTTLVPAIVRVRASLKKLF
jgi:hypothetical protein